MPPAQIISIVLRKANRKPRPARALRALLTERGFKLGSVVELGHPNVKQTTVTEALTNAAGFARKTAKPNLTVIVFEGHNAEDATSPGWALGSNGEKGTVRASKIANIFHTFPAESTIVVLNNCCDAAQLAPVAPGPDDEPNKNLALRQKDLAIVDNEIRKPSTVDRTAVFSSALITMTSGPSIVILSSTDTTILFDQLSEWTDSLLERAKRNPTLSYQELAHPLIGLSRGSSLSSPPELVKDCAFKL
jgi:hypothetical protein